MSSANDIYYFKVEGIQELVRGKIKNKEDGFYLLSEVKFVDSQGTKRSSLKSKDNMFYINAEKIVYFYLSDIAEP